MCGDAKINLQCASKQLRISTQNDESAFKQVAKKVQPHISLR